MYMIRKKVNILKNKSKGRLDVSTQKIKGHSFFMSAHVTNLDILNPLETATIMYIFTQTF